MPRSLLAAAGTLLAFAAGAAAAEGRPGFKSHRFDEDWRPYCADAGAPPEPLKCVRLAGSALLSLGGELRERVEAASRPGFGLEQDSDHVFLHRAKAHADLRLGDGTRAFAQVGAFGYTGREGERGAFDLDRLDLTQGFLDLSAGAGGGRATLRAGRQELSLGSSRLVSVRESPNVRRAFDGGRASWEGGGHRADAFYLRPVRVEAGVLDDSANDAEALWGAHGMGPVAGALRADLYYLGFRRDRGAFAGGTGGESRHTLGARLFGEAGGWDWDVEAAYQRGGLGTLDVRAWTVAADVGLTLGGMAWAPRLGLKADVASGDGDPGDGRLGTFNALYPKLPYFSEANLVAPANVMDLHPSVRLSPAAGLELEISWNVLWRHRTADAAYAPPLSAVPGTAGRPGRFLGHQVVAGLGWQASRHVTVTGQYVHFEPGGAIERAGGGAVDFATVSVAAKF